VQPVCRQLHGGCLDVSKVIYTNAAANRGEESRKAFEFLMNCGGK
jgi:hypothetical protein